MVQQNGKSAGAGLLTGGYKEIAYTTKVQLVKPRYGEHNQARLKRFTIGAGRRIPESIERRRRLVRVWIVDELSKTAQGWLCLRSSLAR